eukprot:PITA_08556
MARTMMNDSKLGDVQAMETAVHIQNRGMLRSNSDKTVYELRKGRPANVKNSRIFGNKYYFKREDKTSGKFDSRKNHPPDQNIGDVNAGIGTRRSKSKQCHLALLSTFKPSSFEEARHDIHWIKAMEEELDQIEKNDTWELVPRSRDKNVIGTKWVFKNTLNEDGQVSRNKARLICNRYAQVEGIGFEETFALVAKMGSY